jgi:HK97 family phage prohead protease
MEKERRVLAFKPELRGEGEERRIVGYAAKFNSRSVDLGGFFEEIDPGAFDRALKEEHDVRALVDHNPTLILGRTTSGTLALSVDKEGLLAEIQPPDTQASRDIQESLRRGDVTGMSFAFAVIADEWRTEDKVPIRVLRDLDLFDVSVVTYPAYPETEVSMRAKDRARAEATPPPAAPVNRLDREIGLNDRA